MKEMRSESLEHLNEITEVIEIRFNHFNAPETARFYVYLDLIFNPKS